MVLRLLQPERVKKTTLPLRVGCDCNKHLKCGCSFRIRYWVEVGRDFKMYARKSLCFCEHVIKGSFGDGLEKEGDL